MAANDCDQKVAAFIADWAGADGSEFSNAQPFVNDLCEMLGVERPGKAVKDDRFNKYVFERWVTPPWLGSDTPPRRRIDCYKRGCFVLEAKKLAGGGDCAPGQADLPGIPATKGGKNWSIRMVQAREQAAGYADAIGRDEGWPPFLVIVDIGNVIELFADFSLTGKNYTHFPDARSFRIRMSDLRDAKVRDRLRMVWQDPLSLDPARETARVTRAIAGQLADLAKSLEEDHTADRVAGFLMRCLFTMFAEDVGLLPKDCFKRKLESWLDKPEAFRPGVEEIWRTMDKGGHSVVLEERVRYFNGGLFADADALDLTPHQIKQLLEAARAEWKDVDPAIFGTLLERALDPRERQRLGAHYTPRAYVERLVLATVIEPLREDWTNVKAAAIMRDRKGAIDEVRRFHDRLCGLRILDPACGTGNFLYVTLEHMKRLEGEVIDFMTEELGQHQGVLELDTHTVDPHQFLGLEKNARAVPIAELVLWIGYLQWHFRTRGRTQPAEPVLRNFHNIQKGDAVLAWDDRTAVLDGDGNPVTRWDGESMTTDLRTGREIPATDRRVQVWRYHGARPATWPEVDFIVGNPPFIGGKDLRLRLGDGYAEALWQAYPDLPNSVDFVMYWWHKAAQAVRDGRAEAFGFITTNSLPQTFSSRVVAHHLAAEPPLSLVFAIPNHPWVKPGDCPDRRELRQAAAVRIAMTVGRAGRQPGRLLTVTSEKPGQTDAAEVVLSERVGPIHANLTVGADVASVKPLAANEGLSSRGVSLHGAGFIVTREEAARLGLGTVPGLERHIRPYRNGKDLTGHSRDVMVIDLFGLDEDAVRRDFPAVFQHLRDTVWPERSENNRASYRLNWWVFGEPRRDLRPALAGLPRYIATVETAKHRVFQFLDETVLPDNKVVAFALADAAFLGVLSSAVHVRWAVLAGGRMGIGNDPVYNKTRCFDPFPFPLPPPPLRERIRALGEELDGFRKARLADNPDLTLTQLYNVLDKLRTKSALTEAESDIHNRAMVGTLAAIHQALDAAVFDAYGWPHDLAEAEIVERLVALNAARAEDERRGVIHWLRPELQAPAQAPDIQPEMDVAVPLAAARITPEPWPADLLGQVSAIRLRLARLPEPADPATIARTFRRAPKTRVAEVLSTLVAMGRARQTQGRYWL